ncbi:MAG TPA: hypothetical protein VIV35_03965 [Chitinophagaceae bacterium]
MKTILFILVSFIAITATLSGLLMISDPGGGILNLPLSLLDNTPFKDYRIPGILLTIMVGGVNLIALFFNMQRHPSRYNWAMAGGFMISVWILVQLLLVQAAHWLHFIYLGIGLLIILIAYQLKGKWAV